MDLDALMTAIRAKCALSSGEKRARGRPVRSAMVDGEALLKTARQALARPGFEATSVRGIARDAGVDSVLAWANHAR
jgi:TetR/AcrR family transcriptional regulator